MSHITPLACHVSKEIVSDGGLPCIHSVVVIGCIGVIGGSFTAGFLEEFLIREETIDRKN